MAFSSLVHFILTADPPSCTLSSSVGLRGPLSVFSMWAYQRQFLACIVDRVLILPLLLKCIFAEYRILGWVSPECLGRLLCRVLTFISYQKSAVTLLFALRYVTSLFPLSFFFFLLWECPSSSHVMHPIVHVLVWSLELMVQLLGSTGSPFSSSLRNLPVTGESSNWCARLSWVQQRCHAPALEPQRCPGACPGATTLSRRLPQIHSPVQAPARNPQPCPGACPGAIAPTLSLIWEDHGPLWSVVQSPISCFLIF